MGEHWYSNLEVLHSSPGPVKVFFATFSNRLKVRSQFFPCLYEMNENQTLLDREEHWYGNPEVSGLSPGPVKVFFANFSN